MKNITVSVDDETYRTGVRIVAASRGTSVSGHRARVSGPPDFGPRGARRLGRGLGRGRRLGSRGRRAPNPRPDVRWPSLISFRCRTSRLRHALYSRPELRTNLRWRNRRGPVLSHPPSCRNRTGSPSHESNARPGLHNGKGLQEHRLHRGVAARRDERAHRPERIGQVQLRWRILLPERYPVGQTAGLRRQGRRRRQGTALRRQGN